MSNSKITLHWVNVSRATRLLWFFEELGVEYTVVPYARVGARAPASLKAIHPLGKTPIVEIEKDGKKKVLVESGHIINYMIKHYDTEGKFRPVSEEDEEDVDYYVQMAEASLMPPFMVDLVLKIAGTKLAPWYMKPIIMGLKSKLTEMYVSPDITGILDLLEAHLKEKYDEGKELYFVGEKLSAADIMIQWHTRIFSNYDALMPTVNKEKYPLLFKWMEQMEARPAYRKMEELEKGYCEELGITGAH